MTQQGVPARNDPSALARRRTRLDPTGQRDTNPAKESLRYATGVCPLGTALAAVSPYGLACILLGDEAEALVAELKARFAIAFAVTQDAAVQTQLTAVIKFIERPALGLQLQLDLRGTPFQQRVWRALQNIPVGQVASYAQVAQRIGAKGGARAVASACAANPIAVAVPCHRVVGSDGRLSGYRWGIERKRALLVREAAQHLGRASLTNG